ncbi:UNKNOWN [Stylonychia lemnae]|uniref:Uncharacterized protein n=1 Tax=Stylonychia lemnae TaxID=5949 RepID=A0A078A1R2_STYLE|nr:UNKNOWN [Stylonychia lemnae]|eukprot:CDW76191.1 UNKNOWN [Stylonychia lemnae]
MFTPNNNEELNSILQQLQQKNCKKQVHKRTASQGQTSLVRKQEALQNSQAISQRPIEIQFQEEVPEQQSQFLMRRGRKTKSIVYQSVSEKERQMFEKQSQQSRQESSQNKHKRFNEDLTMVDVDLSKTQKIVQDNLQKKGQIFYRTRKSIGETRKQVDQLFQGSTPNSFINHQDFDPYLQKDSNQGSLKKLRVDIDQALSKIRPNTRSSMKSKDSVMSTLDKKQDLIEAIKSMDDQQLHKSYYGIKQIINESQKGGDSTQNSTPYGDSRNQVDINQIKDDKSMGSFINSSRPLSVGTHNTVSKKIDEKSVLERQEKERMEKLIADLQKKNDNLTKALNQFVLDESKNISRRYSSKEKQHQ